MNLIKLYRPVGLKELELIKASDWKKFPPRLPEQPFFYPVLNQEYATQIARDWNTKDAQSSYQGYVLEFNVNGDFLQKHNLEIQTVGSKIHQEYWVPAELLAEFNSYLVGTIVLIEEFK